LFQEWRHSSPRKVETDEIINWYMWGENLHINFLWNAKKIIVLIMRQNSDRRESFHGAQDANAPHSP